MTATPETAAIRVAVDRFHGSTTTSEQTRFEQMGLKIVGVQSTSSRHRAIWRSSAGDAVVTIDHELSNQYLACAYFTGARRLDFAVQLGGSLSYMPIEIMHLTARTSPAAQARRAAVRVLGQFYATEDEASYWDADIGETLALARQDEDSEVRMDALIAEMKGHPTAAVEHLTDELSRQSTLDRRELLEALMSVAERAAASAIPVGPDRPGSCDLRDGPLAIPFFNDESSADFVGRFGGMAEVVQLREDEGPITPGGSEVIELRAVELDATITYTASKTAPIGCLRFAGTDRVEVATGTASAVSYFPVHLATQAAHFGPSEETRALGSLAVTLASTER